MPIVADIDDLSAAEFLLMVSLNRKSGKLSGVNGDARVMLAFRNGSIVYAASTEMRERIGSILVSRRLITEEELQEAVNRQQQETGVKHLGNILVEMGIISKQALADVVQSQFEKVLAELLSWQSGVLSFSRLDIPDLGAVHVDPREILYDMGFETEQLLLGTMSALEDSQRDAAQAAAAASVEEAGPAEELSAEAHELMRSMMQEMQSLSLSITAEVSLDILTCATELVQRAVLLIVYPNHLGGVGGYGVDLGELSSEEVVRSFTIPRGPDSIFSAVIEEGAAYTGALRSSRIDQQVVEQLGGPAPQTVIAVPLIVGGKVLAVLYGDNAGEERSIGTLERLIAAMTRAGDTIEAMQSHR